MNSLLQRLIQIEMVMESLMCGPQEPGHGGTGKHTIQHLKLLFDHTFFRNMAILCEQIGRYMYLSSSQEQSTYVG